MKAQIAVRLGLAITAVMMAGTVLAQGPGGGQEMGAEPGPGFGEHRPPMERAFGAGGDHGRWWNNPKIVERLKLSDDQRKAMDGILQVHREKLVDLRGSLEKAELEMEPLMRDDHPNEARILSQIDKVAQSRAELEKANARFLLAIRGKLTAEQWKQLQADRKDREPERRGWGPGGQFRRPVPPPLPAPPDAAPQEGAPQDAAPQGTVPQQPPASAVLGAGTGDEQ
ncbi:MAG: periplasmic heavy metal sensor [Terracidiphilus sp.]|nr:periplasmic heavy metal sensor [Terracidiphilus sp.]